MFCGANRLFVGVFHLKQEWTGQTACYQVNAALTRIEQDLGSEKVQGAVNPRSQYIMGHYVKIEFILDVL